MTSAGHVVIAGGSGFLGRSLGKHLGAAGWEVTLLSRNIPRDGGPWTHVRWDGRTLGDWASCLEGATALVNLAGRSVDCVKTPDHCDEILRSRVDSTRVLGEAMRQVSAPPAVWVQMATAHRYGESELPCEEESPFGWGLAPFVGARWEEAFAEALPQDVRGVVLRTSFVLGRDGGALTTLVRLARLGFGGTIGHGRQGISWIHEADMNRIFGRAIEETSMQGAYIASAPKPVSNRVFMQALRKALRAPIGLPAMAWMVRMAAPILRTDAEMALYGRYVTSRRLRDEGFEFRFPDVQPALEDLLRG